MGLGSAQCLVQVPAGSRLKHVARGARDLGAAIVHRYQDGKLTRPPLWDPTTGGFPCGAVVAGVNDGPTRCSNVQARLNIEARGCRSPASPSSEAPSEVGDEAGGGVPSATR